MYLIIGLGKTGLSAARYFHRHDHSFIVFDTRDHPSEFAAFQKEFPEIKIVLGHLPNETLSLIKTAIVSPGLSLDSSICQQLKSAHIPILNDIEFLAQQIDAPMIAITGTNGKSTVTALVGEMAKAFGIKVAVGGNIGIPVFDLLQNKAVYELWVLELSSFHLELTQSLIPLASTILNVSPDHLDRHHTLEAYAATKQRIYHQAQVVVYNREDDLTKPQTFAKQKISFGLNAPEEGMWGILLKDNTLYLAQGLIGLLPVDAMRIKGRHNWANALAACALAATAGVDYATMTKVLQCFAGLPHRCQWVRKLRGVDWINDSKGTNIGATISAISGIGGSMQGRIVLIAGGQGKGADFKALRTTMGDYVRSVVLMGEDAEEIAQALYNIVPVIRANSLEEAVLLAKAEAQEGDVVLLSPACASFDMFRDYQHRGQKFTEAVNAL